MQLIIVETLFVRNVICSSLKIPKECDLFDREYAFAELALYFYLGELFM